MQSWYILLLSLTIETCHFQVFCTAKEICHPQNWCYSVLIDSIMNVGSEIPEIDFYCNDTFCTDFRLNVFFDKPIEYNRLQLFSPIFSHEFSYQTRRGSVWWLLMVTLILAHLSKNVKSVQTIFLTYKLYFTSSFYQIQISHYSSLLPPRIMSPQNNITYLINNAQIQISI